MHRQRIVFLFCPYLIVCALVLPNLTWAQYINYEVEEFRKDNGLPFQSATDIHEDELGFLWMTTEQGLARFDGISYTLFDHTLPRPPHDSLAAQEDSPPLLITLQEDDDGNFWMGSDDGLVYFDRKKESFQHFDIGKVIHIAPPIDDSPFIWLALENRSLVKFDTRSHQFEISTDANGETVHLVNGNNFGPKLYEDQDAIWSAGWGVYRYDKASKEIDQFLPDPTYPTWNLDDWPLNQANSLNTLIASPLEDSVLWIGAWGGLFRFDMRTSTFERHIDRRVVGTHISSSGQFWVATREWLYLLDTARNQFDPIVETRIAQHFWESLHQDKSGTLWASTFFGIRKITPPAYPFTWYRKPPPSMFSDMQRGIIEEEDGHILMSTSSGIVRIDRTGSTPPAYADIPHKGHTTSMFIDSQRNYWISGGPKGLMKYTPQTKSVQYYTHDPQNSESRSNGSLNKMLEDNEGIYWLGHDPGGLNRYDPIAGVFERFMNDPNNENSLVSNRVNHLFIPPSTPRVLWIGTFEGLSRLDLDTHTFTNIKADSIGSTVQSFHEDKLGRLWMSTTKGLHRYDRDLDTITWFPMGEGFPPNELGPSLEDDAGNIWFGTSEGLIQFDPITETFTHFTTKDGLPSDRFTENGFFRSSTGELFFMTADTDGFTWFSFFPDQILKKTIVPTSVLTRLAIKGEPASPSSNESLTQSISYANSIVLASRDNELTFQFAGLGTPNPEDVTYQYYLEGFDETWIDNAKQRSVRYNRLPPGEYTFQVRSTYQDNVWSAPRSLSITINPPWWRTTWAYILYMFGVLGLVFGVNRIQRQRLIAKERQQAQIREAELKTEAAQALSREATAMAREKESEARALQAENDRKQLEIEKGKELEKSYRELQQALTHLRETQDQLVHTEKLASLGQLTAGIAHEIKNPLNFVNNFSRLSKDLMEELEEWIQQRNIQSDEDLEDIIDTLKMNVAKIHHHGNRADGIVKSMLEHSRTEPGQQRATDVNKLLDEYVNLAFHSWKAAHTDEETLPTIIRDYDESVGEIHLIPQNIGRVLINLLDNALYAVNEKSGDNSPESGVVRVKTVRDGDAVEITIADNGTGIPEEIQGKIFEPFFTTKPTGSGTGLGLSLSYDIVVQGHGGELKVESQAGEGATFVIRLPI